MEEKLTKSNYIKQILAIALPISIQSLLASSLGVIDQLMVGFLGEDSISAIFFASKFPTVFFFTSGSISVGAAILISQYIGKKEGKNISDAFSFTFLIGIMLSLVFFMITFIFSNSLLSLFTPETNIQAEGSVYLKIVSIGFIPGFISTMIGSLLRTMNKAKQQVIASMASVVMNTALNYLLIFGILWIPALGSVGAAIATTTARFIELAILIYFFKKHQLNTEYPVKLSYVPVHSSLAKITIKIITPILLSEFAWSLGEAVYGMIYGHISKYESSAMSLIGPMMILSIGMFAGLSQAASILVGKELGKSDHEMAIFLGSKSIKIGIIGSAIIGVIVLVLAPFYPNIFPIELQTKTATSSLLIVWAIVLWIKVSNMILGGIIKSGGKTFYVFLMDIIGTWGIGIPLGLLSANVLHFPVALVYLFISFEEFVRFIVGYRIFKSRKWVQTI